MFFLCTLVEFVRKQCMALLDYMFVYLYNFVTNINEDAKEFSLSILYHL